MVILPIGVAPETFYRNIHEERDFDLAYVPFDYKDDLYSLNYLLDPAAIDVGGRNYLGYLGKGTNPQTDDTDLRFTIEELRSSRDFEGHVRPETWKLHNKFLNRMPFIPLWQLDRFIVVQNSLEIFQDYQSKPVSAELIDPATVFTGVELWRFK